jgi:hypothetical protein
MNATDAIRRLPELAERHDNMLVFWYPGAAGKDPMGRMHVQTYDNQPVIMREHSVNMRDQPVTAPWSAQSKATGPSRLAAAKMTTLAHIPGALGLYQRHVSTGAPTTVRTMPWNIGALEGDSIQPHDVSYAVPYDKLQPTLAGLREVFRKNGRTPPIELWIRAVAKGDSAMSASFTGPKWMVEFFPMQHVGSHRWQQRLMNDARAVFAANGGMRHWAKEGTGGVERLPADVVAGFQNLRRQLDPGGRTAGPYTREIGLDP